jgi:DamX protein
MSASAQAIKFQTTSESVTKISANARIDYILRFSKQAVLVVDDDLEQCSTVASQFLSNLPNHHNAAFVSVSAKLNNIQVRCRLIEQLFNNEFFDPEQSIAVSLINLVKQKKQAISIVVNNAHLLSLQLIHELCQLADIAQKANYKISVLLLGSPQAGVIAANNSQLFDKKLSIISAQTGQLLSLNAKLFKVKHPLFQWNTKKKLLCVLAVISLGLVAVLTWVLTAKPPSFSGLTADVVSQVANDGTDNFVQSSSAKPNSAQPNSAQANSAKDDGLQTKQLLSTNKVNNRASAADVLRALESPLTAETNEQQPILPALPIDIVNALQMDQREQINSDKQLSVTSSSAEQQKGITAVASQSSEDPTLVDKVPLDETKTPLSTFTDTTAEYYPSFQQGYVVQIAVFSQADAFQGFIVQHSNNQFYSYFRLLNGQKFLVITSKVYANWQSATDAMTLLPKSLQDKQPWIKSISAINNEISSFQRSQ